MTEVFAGSGHPCLAIVEVPSIKRLDTLLSVGTEWVQCGKVDSQKAMCFRGESWCCDNHRKLIIKAAEQVAEKAQRVREATWDEYCRGGTVRGTGCRRLRPAGIEGPWYCSTHVDQRA